LAAILEGFQDVRDRQQIALIVDEERVAEKSVVIAMCGRRFVEPINNRANGRAKRAIRLGVFGASADKEACRAGNYRRQKQCELLGWFHERRLKNRLQAQIQIEMYAEIPWQGRPEKVQVPQKDEALQVVRP
jgi:hypothetical protein